MHWVWLLRGLLDELLLFGLGAVCWSNNFFLNPCQRILIIIITKQYKITYKQYWYKLQNIGIEIHHENHGNKIFILNYCTILIQYYLFLTFIISKMKWILIAIALLVTAMSEQFQATTCEELSFLPMPKQIKCKIEDKEKKIIQNPCSILYKIKGSDNNDNYKHFVELIQHQQYKSFGCHLAHIAIGQMTQIVAKGFKYTVQIQVASYKLKSAFTTQQQAYQIKIEHESAYIKSQTYVGFVRGLETFIQSITCDKYKVANCYMKHLPIQITDEPAFIYRSVMIDTSRHYQPLHLIYETIDALMYNKMNILHWHIVDEDSFPLKLKSHPEIAQYAAFSPEEIYTTDDVQEIVRYALVRGVRVIPELDTPGHAASWGRAPQNKNVACTFGNTGYMGPLDVTLDATYKLVKEVFTQIFQLFPDPFVHLGGDEVVLTCLSNKTSFLQAEGIQQGAIQLRYRQKQRKMLKQINSTKRFIYWMNSQIQLEGDDIVHWWGGGLPSTKHELIISQYGPFYIDMGVGNYFGVSYGSYVTWLDLYNQNIGKMIENYDNKKNVLGAEVTLWSEISNQYTHHVKIWIRTSSLAERSWNLKDQKAKPDFFRRITAHERLMNRRGIPTAPGTCQQCEFNPQYCS